MIRWLLVFVLVSISVNVESEENVWRKVPIYDSLDDSETGFVVRSPIVLDVLDGEVESWIDIECDDFYETEIEIHLTTGQALYVNGFSGESGEMRYIVDGDVRSVEMEHLYNSDVFRPQRKSGQYYSEAHRELIDSFLSGGELAYSFYGWGDEHDYKRWHFDMTGARDLVSQLSCYTQG